MAGKSIFVYGYAAFGMVLFWMSSVEITDVSRNELQEPSRKSKLSPLWESSIEELMFCRTSFGDSLVHIVYATIN